MQGHRRLRAWQLGMDLAEEAYRLTRSFPADERFGLTSQMKRAATSIPMNLAEGFGRGGRDFVRFVGIAYGSLLELETQIELAQRLALITDDNGQMLLQRTAELGKIVNGLRRALTTALERRADHIREDDAEYGGLH